MIFETDWIQELAIQNGFDRIAAVPAVDVPPIYQRWLTDARERFPHLKLPTDPRDEMPNAETVLLCSRCYPYFKEYPPDCARVSGYYLSAHRAYCDANQMLSVLREKGVEAKFSGLPIKPLARACGFGDYTQNTLITSDGPMRLFQVIVTNAKVLPYATLLGDENQEASGLIHAERSCLSNALQDGEIDLNRCIRNFMLRGTVVPEPLRRQMGMRLLGCDHCQWHSGIIGESVPNDYAELFSLQTLLDSEALHDLKDRLADLIGANYARPRPILCQAALIAGNAPNAERYMPYLDKLKDHEDAAIREHALWSIERICERGQRCEAPPRTPPGARRRKLR